MWLGGLPMGGKGAEIEVRAEICMHAEIEILARITVGTCNTVQLCTRIMGQKTKPTAPFYKRHKKFVTATVGDFLEFLISLSWRCMMCRHNSSFVVLANYKRIGSKGQEMQYVRMFYCYYP